MSRAADLTSFLGEFAPQTDGQPFDWETHNCAHFVCTWVRRATGNDPMDGLPATADARAALRLVQVLGGSLAAAFERLHRGHPIAPEFAQTGDIVLVATDGSGVGEALGICSGRHAVLIDAAGAAAFIPMTSARRAWRLA